MTEDRQKPVSIANDKRSSGKSHFAAKASSRAGLALEQDACKASGILTLWWRADRSSRVLGGYSSASTGELKNPPSQITLLAALEQVVHLSVGTIVLFVSLSCIRLIAAIRISRDVPWSRYCAHPEHSFPPPGSPQSLPPSGRR